MQTSSTLSPSSLALFKALAEDAPNWNDQPMFDGTKEARGNLTDLKKRGLLVTQVDDGITWVLFTKNGAHFASTLGFDVRPTAREA
jgi:hypothetical protein